jgi:hypothetical protein
MKSTKDVIFKELQAAKETIEKLQAEKFDPKKEVEAKGCYYSCKG